MASHFNHARIKRQAHNLSRQSTNTRNPFAHIQWGPNKRSGTFPQDLEAARGSRGELEDENNDVESGSPVTHTSTAPAHFGGEDASDKHDEIQPFEQRHTQKTETSAGQASDDTAVDSLSTNAQNHAGGLKNRKPASSGEDAPNDAEEDGSNGKKKGKQDRALFKHVYPKEPFTVRNQLQRTFLNSWINLLLVAAPIGIAINFVPGMTPIAIFVVNFVAIVPLAAMLSFATEEIALRTGETLGGLLNASFGNAVELIVAIIALTKNEIVVVQTSLIGSILSNLLLVMGMCFFFGGLNRQEQFFNTTVAQTAASLLALAVAGVIVPTVFDVASITSVEDVASLSRGTAVILLVIYGAYLFFQLKTHSDVFNMESQKVPAKPFKHSKHAKHAKKHGTVKGGLVGPAAAMANKVSNNADERKRLSEMMLDPPHEEESEGEDPQLHFFVALALLAGSTVIIALCAEFLVDSIDYVTTQGHISKEFLGLILLPIVGNAAEHATAVTVAIKDKMDLAIGVAVGSSMQVALFIIPLLVVIGWGMGISEMSLSFDVFQVAVLFVSVLLVNYLIADGKSHWLEGMQLMCLYIIIAVCSWWYPTTQSE